MSDKIPEILINGRALPESAVLFELSRLVRFYAQHMPEDQVRAQLPELRRRAIEQAIGSRLLFDETAALGIQVPAEEIDASVAAMIEQCGGREKFIEILKKQNSNEEAFRAQVERGRAVDKRVEQIVADAPEPTESDLKEHFDAHGDEYSRPEQVLAQHILITPETSDAAGKKAARDKLEDIRKRACEGADFGALAKEFSDCPSGKEGGSLGWFSRGMMVPAFEEAAFKMNVGEVSEVIETQFGFHIIYKTDAEESREANFDEARESIRDFLRHALRGQLLADHVNELRSKAKIEIKE